jgi:oligogalacturonide transport system permease protein
MSKKHSVSLKTKSSLIGTLFMSPWLIGLLVFTVIPFVYSVWISLCTVEFGAEGISTSFVGFHWYKEIFTADAYFIEAMRDTLQFIVLFTPMIIVVAIMCALLLNKVCYGRTIFRILFFFPVVVISGPVMEKLVGNQAMSIISAGNYYVYQVIENLPSPISVPLLYIFDNIVLILWYSGVQMLIILAGLQKIGDSLYEAASIDGASAWQQFWKITLPYLRPMILIMTVYTVVDLAAMTSTPMYSLIENNVTNIERPYSYSAALSWVFALVVLLLLAIVLLILRERGSRKYE